MRKNLTITQKWTFNVCAAVDFYFLFFIRSEEARAAKTEKWTRRQWKTRSRIQKKINVVHIHGGANEKERWVCEWTFEDERMEQNENEQKIGRGSNFDNVNNIKWTCL